MPSSLSLRRFPPPWVIEEHDKARFIAPAGKCSPTSISRRSRAAAPRGQAADPRRGPAHRQASRGCCASGLLRPGAGPSVRGRAGAARALMGRARTPLPAAMVRRRGQLQAGSTVLHRPRRQPAGAGLRLFRGGSRGRRAAAHLPTYDEARRVAANIAKLPGPGAQAVRHQKLPAAFSGPARGILRRDCRSGATRWGHHGRGWGGKRAGDKLTAA